ncbi:MAG: TIGR01777 family oxidoreductase [Sediminibacterium sp.]
MQTVLITGGTGMVGQSLTNLLLAKGYKVIVLTRQKKQSSRTHFSYAQWDVKKGWIDPSAIAAADYIIHLAGEGVADKRWTTARKKAILDSRVDTSALIVKSLKDNPNKVKAIVAASAIGWYGPDNEKSIQTGFVETDPVDSSFLGDTCKLWEESMHPVKEMGIRLVTIRIGIVFNVKGGALAEFMKPARFGAAAILGDGKQMISWIHQQDLNRLMLFALEQEQVIGVYNAVAPDPVNNATLTKAIAQRFHKWSIPFNVPSFILKIMLGEMSVEVLKSAKVSAAKIIAAGFSFDYASMDEALDDLLISNWSSRSDH